MTNNTFSPPSIRSGANYLFHRDHTELHIFTKAAEIWSEKYQGQQLEYKEFKVATNFTVKNVIERIVARDADKAEWAASEVIEMGGGEWRQGTTFEYSSDKAKGQLADVGWDSKRGRCLPPVWLCIHKINKAYH
ncbi:hypothetical protein K431DRAFT_249878 [Polychaeton citri CBS 116435]|uniref:Uncharacterized protein n=1 Tax=Polychaeton citri CBS 116435 TaxID=1314669 RepID=A0A9P4Q8P1_9PEZI|nr:hypothetical protein K431DRAFT_249878 [Polychaeton citri CBS 116435]